MRYQPVSDLPMIEEDDATGEVAQMYAEIRREMGLLYIPNAAKTLAVSPAALGIFCDITRSYGQRATLPQSLISMILYYDCEDRRLQVLQRDQRACLPHPWRG